MIGSWLATYFPAGSSASDVELYELVDEAAEAARNDFGIEAANEWAAGYKFPAEYVESDVRCLRAMRRW